MKNLILPLTLITMALLETACSGDKKPVAPTPTMNACWSSGMDQSNPACQQVASTLQNAKAFAEVPQPGASKFATVTGVSNPAQAPAVAGSTGMAIASVSPASDAAIKAQSTRVQSALESYSENPDSSYYDPATPKRTVASTPVTNDIAPASVIAAPVAPTVVESSLASAPAASTGSVSGGTSR